MAVVMRHGVKIHDEVQCGMGNVVGLFVGPYQHWGVMRMNMEKILTWKQVIIIPQYLIQHIGDCGTSETWSSTGELLDSDDLRIAVELSGGHDVLIPPGARLIIGDTGI